MGEMDFESAQRFREQVDETVGDWIADHCPDLGTLYGCLPEPDQQLPEEGGWVVVRHQPYTAIPSPPFASIWRAVPVFASRVFRGSRPGTRRKTLTVPEERARLVTPAGEVTLLATEYAVVRDLRPYLDAEGEGVTLHLMGPGTAEGDLLDRVFYLRAHGLRLAEALTLLLPEVRDQSFAWLSVDGVSDVEEYERALAEHRAAVPA